MQVGKLTIDQLKKLVFSNIKNNRNEVIVNPDIGADCAVIDFGEEICVMSTDPITGTSEEIGKLAVHITCNDIATTGVEPLGIMITIMAPEGTTEYEINKIMKDISDEARKLNVDIIGGHTEITTAVNRIIISSTGVGKAPKCKLNNMEKAQSEDFILLTKGAGIEGTGIICFEKEDELKNVYGEELIKDGKSLLNNISVVKEGIIAGKIGTTFMHDVTEGGILGAIWEICHLKKLGCEIYEDKINIHNSTKIICKHYNIDPLRLISSGSMIIGVKGEKLDILEESFRKEGIEYSVIGKLTDNNTKLLINNLGVHEIKPPESDELYKVI